MDVGYCYKCLDIVWSRCVSAMTASLATSLLITLPLHFIVELQFEFKTVTLNTYVDKCEPD